MVHLILIGGGGEDLFLGLLFQWHTLRFDIVTPKTPPEKRGFDSNLLGELGSIHFSASSPLPLKKRDINKLTLFHSHHAHSQAFF
jgi:hypothetical protein